MSGYDCEDDTLYMSAQGGSCDAACPTGTVCDAAKTSAISSSCLQSAVASGGGSCDIGPSANGLVSSPRVFYNGNYE
jgi:hypothetical protein